MQDRGDDEDNDKHRDRDRGKEPARVPDKQEKECSGNEVILVRNRPFRSPLTVESPLEETLDDIPEECTGGEQHHGQERVPWQVSPRELAARVKVVLRRSARRDRPPVLLQEGPFELDTEAYTLSYFGEAVELTRGEYELMKTFVSYPARVFVRDDLIRRMYDESHPVTDRTIDAYIKRIRKKLQDIRPGINPIQTVYGLGYKLNRELGEESSA